MIAGAVSYWIIQDFPDTAKFLTEAERTVVIRRLQQDNQFSAAGEKFQFKYVIMSVKDWKTWVGSKLTDRFYSLYTVIQCSLHASAYIYGR